VLAWLVCAIAAAEQGGFVTDPNSPTLRAYAPPLQVDEAQYGCGPLGVERRMRTAENCVYHDRERPSHILLPVMPGE
jgi:hypothetical protein